MTSRGGALRAGALLTVLTLATACSVSTPRHGTSQGFTTEFEAVDGAPDAPVAIGGSAEIGDPGIAGPQSARAPAGAAATAGDGGSARASRSSDNPSPTAAGPTTGVTRSTITISALAGFSGNFGAIVTKIYENGFLVWVDDVNANGGIHGRRIVVKKVDNRDTVEGGVAACKEVTANGSYLAVGIVGFGGADVSSADCLDRAGVTFLAFNLSSFNPSWRHVYSAGDPGRQTRPLATFIRNVIGERGGVGVIYVRDPLNQSTKDALVDELPKASLKIARVEAVSPNQGSFVAELNRLRQAGASTVVLLVNTEVVGILRDARALGYSPNWTGNYWPKDEDTLAGRSIYDGIRAIRNFSTTNSPAFPEYAAKARRYGRGDVVTSTTMALYGMGLVTDQVLRNVGANPTAASLPSAIESLVDYNNQITMTLSFGKGRRVAEVGMWPIQCCNPDNTWRAIGPPRAQF